MHQCFTTSEKENAWEMSNGFWIILSRWLIFWHQHLQQQDGEVNVRPHDGSGGGADDLVVLVVPSSHPQERYPDPLRNHRSIWANGQQRSSSTGVSRTLFSYVQSNRWTGSNEIKAVRKTPVNIQLIPWYLNCKFKSTLAKFLINPSL